MKVINICWDDYANYSRDNAKSLRSVGVSCLDFKLKKHYFNYDDESPVISREQMIDEIKDADLIQVMHTDDNVLPLCLGLGKRLVVYHTGTRYRQEPDKYNSMFNPLVSMSFTDQTEFMNLGARDIKYIATAIDTDKIKPGKELGDKLIISHHPSNANTKGTTEIIKMLLPFANDFDIRINTAIVGHDGNLKRIQECDIYIELFAPMQLGKTYGCFGVTAFEAAAMGKVVITQNLNPNVYSDVYGECVFMCPYNEEHFIRDIEFLKTANIASMQKLSREMMVKRHSYQANGLRLKGMLGI